MTDSPKEEGATEPETEETAQEPDARSSKRADTADAYESPARSHKKRTRKRRGNSLWRPDLARLNVGDVRERVTFISVLVLVSLFIFIGKAFAGLPAWIGLVVSAVGIFGYGLLAWLDRNNRVRMDKAGDNCYYLGLTFTLTSLAAVLYRIDFDVSVAEYIISGFGIAIGSTIFGIIARLVLIQFVEELDDIELKARTRLTESADQLRVDLEDAAGRFQDFMISLQDEVKVSIVSITGEQIKQQRDLIEAVEAALKDAIGTMEQSSNKLADTLNGHSDVISKFNAASERSAKAADNLADKVSSIELPYDQLEEGVGKVIAEIDKLRDGMLALPLVSAAEKLDGYVQATDRVHDRVGEVAAATSEMADKLREIGSTFESSAREGASASKALQETVQELRSGLSSFREVASKYVDGMSEVAESLAEKVDV